ncbi:hypothetical protein [Agrococcus sp. Marseille-P2731]|uniref:hypothetical protein n=1 Tax=Agrococcus sp. Marseille-P2731 TaxID=1841862 RepID=UPI00093168E5|nr:hypothetical protein [Agrococcus sp. Marseille-P2731]
MAQVVRPQGWIGPLVMFVIGIILLLNGVPALLQWLPWIAQSSLIVGVEGALETALVPLVVAFACTFIGFLLMRGGFGALRQRMRGAAGRASAQARSGVQQVRQEAAQRAGNASSQAEHLVNRVPQSWRERIEAAAAAVEQERATQSGQSASQVQRRAPRQGQGQQVGQPYLGQSQQVGQPYLGQGQQQGQGQRMQQGQGAQQGQNAPAQRTQQLPGGDRLQRIEQLRQRVDTRTQEATQQPQQAAKQAAAEARRLAKAAARQASQGLPMHFDAATEALVGQLDAADTERIRRRGSSLVRSSLTSAALSKTSLSTNSLFRHR